MTGGSNLASNAMSRIPVRLLVPAIAWQYRFYEPELARLDKLVPKDRGAVDIGVWWGPWTWRLAHRVPHVDSFEPNADLVSRIAPVMPPNVVIHQVALSDRATHASLWVPDRGAGTEGRASLEPASNSQSGWTRQEVMTARLDDFELENVGFVKIDVEGHELAVLHGAEQLISSDRPTIMIEIEEHEDRQSSLDAIIQFFRAHSYSGAFLQKGRWRSIDQLDRDRTKEMARKVARHGYVGNLLLYSRNYPHNFVFRPD
jgi:FkbM family methyltransferase